MVIAVHRDAVHRLSEQLGVEVRAEFGFCEDIVQQFQPIQHFVLIAVGDFGSAFDPQFGYSAFKRIGLCRVIGGIEQSFAVQTGEDKVLRRKVGDLSVEFFDPLLTACGTVLQLFELADERAEQIRPEMERECERWGYSVALWERMVGILHEYVNNYGGRARCLANAVTGYISMSDDEWNGYFGSIPTA